MHKSNVALTTLAVAAILAGVFLVYPGLSDFAVVGYLYFPAIVLSIIFGGHAPSALAGWSSFAVYTVCYWAVLLVVYAALWEIHLLRQVFHHLEPLNRKNLLRDEPEARLYLEKIGHAIAEVEPRRRKHLLLKNAEVLDLSEAPQLTAARAIAGAGRERLVTTLLGQLEKNLVAEIGAGQAHDVMIQVSAEARTLAARLPPVRKNAPARDAGPPEPLAGAV